MKTHSLFFRLFTTSAVLILVPVIVIYALSSHELLASSESLIGKNVLDKLMVAENTVNQLRDSSYKDGLSLSMNPTVSSLNNYGGTLDFGNSNELIAASQILDILKKMVTTDPHYASVYIYIDGYKYVFTSNEDMVNSSLFSDSVWMKYYKDYKEKRIPVSFVETMNIHSSAISQNDSNFITSYIYPLTPYTTSLDGAIVLNIYESALNKMINSNVSGKGDYVFIINKSGTVVCHGDENLLCKNISGLPYIQTILKSRETSGYFSGETDGTKSLISYYKPVSGDWIYIGVSSINQLTDAQNSIKTKTIYFTFSIAVIGVLAAYFFSKRLYSPLGKLVKTIRSTKGINISDNDDEMSVIYHAFEAISKNDSTLLSPEKSDRNLRENSIRAILKGSIPEAADEQKNLFPYGSFICCLISIDEYGTFSDSFDENQARYIMGMIVEITEQLLKNSDCQCTGFLYDQNEILFTVNFDRIKSDTVPASLSHSFLQVQQEVSKLIDNTLTVGIGNHCSGIKSLGKSYAEAQTAVKQRLKLGFGKVIVWNEDFYNNTYYYPSLVEEHIKNYLDMYSKQDLETEVRNFFEDLKYRENLSCENIMQIINQLIGNTMIKYLIEKYADINDIFGLNYNLYREVSVMETLDELQDFLIGKYSIIIDSLQKGKTNKKFVEKILEYIESHYKTDIGINDISEYAGLSYSYCRKIFKDEVGSNITDYINEMRIREAKELLIKKRLSIKCIAAAIGYNNVQTFIRYFKKYEGITPGEFREKNA